VTVELALLLVSGLVVGITAHEFAHAWTASLLGDDYPRRRGRVSLNPLRHLAPLGTLAVFLLPFGWGRPVPVNLYNFRRPKRDYLLCSLAGPVANLVVVGLCFALMLLTGRCFALGRRMVPALLEGHSALKVVAMLNVMLAVINLLPIPPLDGSKIWPLIIPSLKPGYGARAGGVFIIVLLLLVWSGAVDRVVLRATDWVFEVMPTSDMEVFRGRYEKAMAAFRSCRFVQAERHFSAALAVNPWSPEALYRRALCRRELGQLSRASEDVHRALRLCGRDPRWAHCRKMLRQLRDELTARSAASQPRPPGTSRPARPADAAGPPGPPAPAGATRPAP